MNQTIALFPAFVNSKNKKSFVSFFAVRRVERIWTEGWLKFWRLGGLGIGDDGLGNSGLGVCSKRGNGRRGAKLE